MTTYGVTQEQATRYGLPCGGTLEIVLEQLSQIGIGLGANSVFLKFSRTAESQADLMGSHIMAEAGYDPEQLAKFFDDLPKG